MATKFTWRTVLSVLLIVLFGHLAWATESEAEPQIDFDQWLKELRLEARAAGVSEATLDAALLGIAPLERVIELDRRQPEFTQTFWGYLDKRVTPQRIERGRALMLEHGALLDQIRERYNVQPRFLVAFWALESNFGDYTGKIPVIASLVTLAYDQRRSAFFRAQLLDALRILEARHINNEQMKGSWAGAMGQLQFMPSTFVAYAKDGDQDGRIDLWVSLPDVFASAANYLSKIGWRGDQTWGREVRLPEGFDFNMATLAIWKPIGEWQNLGVRRADGRDLPNADIEGSIIVPAGHGGPAFLVYDNFRATLVWNRSINYALSVGYLADRLVGRPALVAQKPADERPLSRAEVEEIQNHLTQLGYDTGTPDGVVGARTRAAIRSYQRAAALPPDGYPTPELLDGLRDAVTN
ncbi:MAG: lytic murein transglycosylase [Pseudomonadota bacterium]